MYDAHNFEKVLDPDVCIYDAANLVSDERTDKPILGVGYIAHPLTPQKCITISIILGVVYYSWWL